MRSVVHLSCSLGRVCLYVARQNNALVGLTRRLTRRARTNSYVKIVQQWDFLFFPLSHHVSLPYYSTRLYVTTRDSSWRATRRRRQTYCASRHWARMPVMPAHRTRPAHPRHVDRARRDEPWPRYNGGKRSLPKIRGTTTGPVCPSTNNVTVVPTTWRIACFTQWCRTARAIRTHQSDPRIDSIMCRIDDADSARLAWGAPRNTGYPNVSDIIAYP